MTTRPLLPALLLGATLLLPACHSTKPPANSLDAVDNELVEGMPTAETNDLGSAIKVDRARAAQRAAAKPQPGAVATREDATQGPCLARNRDRLSFATSWAGKLPADLPLHPQARLTEAAGHSGDCEVRAASFTVPAEPEAVLAWYEDRAHAGGWDAGRTTRDGELWLAGTKGDAAFAVMTHGEGKTTAVDYIWVNGE